MSSQPFYSTRNVRTMIDDYLHNGRTTRPSDEMLRSIGMHLDDADAWQKGQALLTELRERVIPCDHKIEDLIGGEGAVTKCGACLAERKAKNG